jgi:hypothetical protein
MATPIDTPHKSGTLRLAGQADRPEDDVRNMSPDQKAEWFLDHADDAVLACRGGARHRYDLFRRGSKMPNTWAIASPYGPRGAMLLVQRCSECRLVFRYLKTTANRKMDPGETRWETWYDPRYKAPKGSARISPAQARTTAGARKDAEEPGWMDELAAKNVPAGVAGVLEILAS